MDEIQYPLPKLNPEQEMTIERIMADLLHSSEQAPSPGSLGPDSPSSSLGSPLHNEPMSSMTNDIVYEFIEHMEQGIGGLINRKLTEKWLLPITKLTKKTI